MKIKNKIALVTMSILALIIVIVNFSFALYFHNFITKQENGQIVSANDNIASFLDERIHKYLGSSNDWGHWTDTYDFTNGDYPEFVQDNLPEDTFINLDINFMIITDETDSFFYKQYYSFDTGEFTDCPSEFCGNFSKIIAFSKTADDISGVFQIGQDFYFVAATDITDNEMENTTGKLFIGKSLDDDIIKSLESISGCALVSINSFSADAYDEPDPFQDPPFENTNGAAYQKTQDSIDIKTIIPNKYNKEDSIVFSLLMSRQSYISSMNSVKIFIFLSTFGLLIISAVLYAFLGKYITQPITSLVENVKRIDASEKSFTMLPEEGRDEFTFLSRTINSLLKRINSDYITLANSEEKLKATLKSVGDGVITVDIDGNIAFMNPKALQLTEWDINDVIGKPFNDIFIIINEYTRTKVESPVDMAFGKKQTVELANHTLLISKHGKEIPIEDTAAPITSRNGSISGVVLVFRDFSEKKEKQKHIEYLSYHDQLTGLYNRRFFEEELCRLDVERNLPLSFVYADLDGLKIVNDAFGHDSGDILIQKVAEILKTSCRADDIIARMGGDEFVIIFPRTDTETVKAMSEHLKEKIERINLQDIHISISFGWETKNDIEQSVREALKCAEDLMYQRKILNNSSKRNGIIKSILNTLHVKSPREEAHSKRVSLICRQIGEACNLSNDDVEELAAAGTLHDIGKIAIDKNILNKAGKLTNSEWAQIKNHPETGYRLLGSTSEFNNISEYVLAHHERWDGLGYPKGLTGSEINWKARVIAIADSFDAMTSNRPYQKGKSTESAIEEIIKNAGTQFDPDIARVFVEKVLRAEWKNPGK